MKKLGISTLLIALALLSSNSAFAALPINGGEVATKFTNKGTILNTRHNLTQRPRDNPLGVDGTAMDQYRNNYADVCVYCHTPHGASNQASVQGAPLWNRTYNAGATYDMYNQLGTSSLTKGSVLAGRPGPNSLTCLSCHDGTMSVDSIINMPGPSFYDSGRELWSESAIAGYPDLIDPTKGTPASLNQWGGKATNNHMKLAPGAQTCMSCHVTGGTGVGYANATDFDSYYIGTDLKNDHPVGVTFPTTKDDFRVPDGGGATDGSRWFNDNLSIGGIKTGARLDPADVRIYNGRVECASCHDPHGVPVGGGQRTNDAEFTKTFLRVQNDNSRLCMTCHIK